MKPYHRMYDGCCTAHRLALVHQGFDNEADRRQPMARPWTEEPKGDKLETAIFLVLFALILFAAVWAPDAHV